MDNFYFYWNQLIKLNKYISACVLNINNLKYMDGERLIFNYARIFVYEISQVIIVTYLG